MSKITNEVGLAQSRAGCF